MEARAPRLLEAAATRPVRSSRSSLSARLASSSSSSSSTAASQSRQNTLPRLPWLRVIPFRSPPPPPRASPHLRSVSPLASGELQDKCVAARHRYNRLVLIIDKFEKSNDERVTCTSTVAETHNFARLPPDGSLIRLSHCCLFTSTILLIGGKLGTTRWGIFLIHFRLR